MSEELQDLQQAIVDNIVSNSHAISVAAAKLGSNGNGDSSVSQESRRLALLACLCRANWLLADLKRIERFVR